MTTSQLTDLFIKGLKPGDKQVDYYDTKIKRFGVRVSPSGTKTYFLWYRFQGRAKRLGLGRTDRVSLADARKKAHQALADIADDRDPALTKLSASADGTGPTFAKFVDTFVSKYAKRHNKSWEQTERLLKREFVSKWGKRPLSSLNKADVLSVLDNIVSRGTPSAANRSFAAVRKLFNWAVERGDLDVSPALNVKNPSKHVSRDRVLTEYELSKVWSAADHMGYPYGTVVELLILTAQRRNEVAGMRWSDLNFESNTWTIPGDRNKSGRPQIVPLTDDVLQILEGLPRTHSELVFPGRGRDNPVSGWSKWKRQIDKISGVEEWRLHDLRRTAASMMAKDKVPPHIIERILNHSTGTLGGVAGVYNRYGYQDEMRDALECWGQSILQV